MFFLGVHIAGWILVVLITISFILKFNIKKIRSTGLSLKNIGLLFFNSLTALLVLICLAVLFAQSRTLPFTKTPGLYKDSVSFIKSSGSIHSEQILNGLSKCAMGNIHRCLCDIDSLGEKYPGDNVILKVREIITDGIRLQGENPEFLE